ncbi:hypothetical protein J437_LFUL013032 [Ladona fulva]|uniref:DDE-1 domain-containing protein n=1 Tax=Ladona fulva TaxID=123851 RepID=A0A8K0P831_LADFU|nr:hypothetical protein J437_LFUL013032 [Ladona fulva]
MRTLIRPGTVPTSLGRFKRVLTDEMERELAQHCKDLDSMLYGLTRKHMMKVAFEYADLNGVADRFNNERKSAGKDWLKSFCKWHNLSVRSPEQCSVARAMGFNEVQVTQFYNNLKNCCMEKKFPAHRKFYMDETGISTVPNRPPKVITPKGKKTVCKISSAERGQTVTSVCCMSATGVFVLPALIFPRKRMNHLLYKDAPNGTLPLISDTGYMNSDLFIDWLKHFVKHAKPSPEDPVLLIADNHISHCSLPAVLFCRENHVTFLTLPPHVSHVLQPLDKGKVITLYEVSGIFQKAYIATARVQLAEKAFRVTGIEPYNPEIIGDECYSPSLVTLAPLDKDCTVAVAPEGNEVSPSTSQIDVCIQSIVPLPRNEQRGAKRKRTSQKSEIMTSSPLKDLLEKKQREKEELDEAKANRNLKKNKNGDKIKKGKILKGKKKLILNSNENPVPSTSSVNNEGTICPACGQSYDEDWIQCGLCKVWWHEECSTYEGNGAFVCDYC